MAAAAQPQKPAGRATLIVTVAALTVLAAIGGGLVGKLTIARLRAATAVPAIAQSAAPSPYAGGTEVRELPAIVTNLADPADVRIRLQVAIVYPRAAVEEPSVLAAKVTDDIVAFLKTLSLTQLQGASGLQNLREDLTERAAVRSQGKIREVVIETLVVQ